MERKSCLVFLCTAGEQMAFHCSFASFYLFFSEHFPQCSSVRRRPSQPVCSALMSSSSQFCFVFLEADCKAANGWSSSKEPGPDLSTTAQKSFGYKRNKKKLIKSQDCCCFCYLTEFKRIGRLKLGGLEPLIRLLRV